MAKIKSRVDQLLVEQGFAATQDEAQRLVLAGIVYADTLRLDKPGQQVAGDLELNVKGKTHPFVSRGGLKLQKALDHWTINVTDAVAIDVGASTGGFTDCLLQRWAARIYAVDVGHGQLAWSLQSDSRVIILDRTNARTLTATEIPESPNLIVCDASFIGLRTVLPAALALAAPGAKLVALIKPQFEVGRDNLGAGGVVRDPALHQQTCDDTARWLESIGWTVQGITDSPITGPAGNREFLVYALKSV